MSVWVFRLCRGAAEDMCTIISKCFDLLYTNATMAFLDQSIAEDGSTAKANPHRQGMVRKRTAATSLTGSIWRKIALPIYPMKLH